MPLDLNARADAILQAVLHDDVSGDTLSPDIANFIDLVAGPKAVPTSGEQAVRPEQYRRARNPEDDPESGDSPRDVEPSLSGAIDSAALLLMRRGGYDREVALARRTAAVQYAFQRQGDPDQYAWTSGISRSGGPVWTNTDNPRDKRYQPNEPNTGRRGKGGQAAGAAPPASTQPEQGQQSGQEAAGGEQAAQGGSAPGKPPAGKGKPAKAPKQTKEAKDAAAVKSVLAGLDRDTITPEVLDGLLADDSFLMTATMDQMRGVASALQIDPKGLKSGPKGKLAKKIVDYLKQGKEPVADPMDGLKKRIEAHRFGTPDEALLGDLQKMGIKELRALRDTMGGEKGGTSKSGVAGKILAGVGGKSAESTSDVSLSTNKQESESASEWPDIQSTPETSPEASANTPTPDVAQPATAPVSKISATVSPQTPTPDLAAPPSSGGTGHAAPLRTAANPKTTDSAIDFGDMGAFTHSLSTDPTRKARVDAALETARSLTPEQIGDRIAAINQSRRGNRDSDETAAKNAESQGLKHIQALKEKAAKSGAAAPTKQEQSPAASATAKQAQTAAQPSVQPSAQPSAPTPSPDVTPVPSHLETHAATLEKTAAKVEKTDPESAKIMKREVAATRKKAAIAKKAATAPKRSLEDALGSGEHMSLDELSKATGIDKKEIGNRLGELSQAGKIDTEGMGKDGEPGYRIKGEEQAKVEPAVQDRVAQSTGKAKWTSQDNKDAAQSQATGRPVYSEQPASLERLGQVGNDILSVVREMAKDHAGSEGMVPVHELRDKIGASRREFDDAVRQLRADKKLRPIVISDQSSMSNDQLKKSIYGHGEVYSDVKLPHSESAEIEQTLQPIAPTVIPSTPQMQPASAKPVSKPASSGPPTGISLTPAKPKAVPSTATRPKPVAQPQQTAPTVTAGPEQAGPEMRPIPTKEEEKAGNMAAQAREADEAKGKIPKIVTVHADILNKLKGTNPSPATLETAVKAIPRNDVFAVARAVGATPVEGNPRLTREAIKAHIQGGGQTVAPTTSPDVTPASRTREQHAVDMETAAQKPSSTGTPAQATQAKPVNPAQKHVPLQPKASARPLPQSTAASTVPDMPNARPQHQVADAVKTLAGPRFADPVPLAKLAEALGVTNPQAMHDAILNLQQTGAISLQGKDRQLTPEDRKWQMTGSGGPTDLIHNVLVKDPAKLAEAMKQPAQRQAAKSREQSEAGKQKADQLKEQRRQIPELDKTTASSSLGTATAKPAGQSVPTSAAENKAVASIPPITGRAEDQPALPQNVRVDMGPKDVSAVRSVFGRDVPEQVLAAAVNGVDGANVEVLAIKGEVHVRTTAPGLDADRIFKRRPDGKVECHNDLFATDKGSAYDGHGTAIFLNQVRALRSAGVSYITTQAGGDFAEANARGLNGYVTWPKMGYDGDMDGHQFSRLPPAYQKAMGDKRNVQSLYALPGGQEAWELYGGSISLSFDLGDGSPSMKALNAYVEKRRSQPARPTRGERDKQGSVTERESRRRVELNTKIDAAVASMSAASSGTAADLKAQRQQVPGAGAQPTPPMPVPASPPKPPTGLTNEHRDELIAPALGMAEEGLTADDFVEKVNAEQKRKGEAEIDPKHLEDFYRDVSKGVTGHKVAQPRISPTQTSALWPDSQVQNAFSGGKAYTSEQLGEQLGKSEKDTRETLKDLERLGYVEHTMSKDASNQPIPRYKAVEVPTHLQEPVNRVRRAIKEANDVASRLMEEGNQRGRVDQEHVETEQARVLESLGLDKYKQSDLYHIAHAVGDTMATKSTPKSKLVSNIRRLVMDRFQLALGTNI